MTELMSELRQNSNADESDGEHNGPGFATTLAKGMAILGAFEPGVPLLGNTELAMRTGLSRPTAARLSSTLAALGYLKYDAKRAKYRLSVRALTIARPLLTDMRLRQIARPLMQELAQSLSGTVSMGILDGQSVVYVETARVGDFTIHVPEIGSALPIQRSAIGWAAASLLTTEERSEYEARARRESPAVWRAFKNRYRTGLSQCDELGFCTSEGDYIPNVCAVGVPLYRQRDTGDCLAMNFVVAAFRVKSGDLKNEIGPRLRALAAGIREVAPDVGSPEEGSKVART